VKIIHLHGSISDPKSLALPGETLEALKEDEPFKTVLRALLLPHVVVYLGYRLPPADAYLREELEWLSSAFQDGGTHALLLPEDEYAGRRSELEQLESQAGVWVERFESERGFRAVQHAALIIAPRAEVSAGADIRVVRGEDVGGYFHAPALLYEGERKGSDIATRIALARHGLGDPIVPPLDLLGDRRAVVVAEPGMGKTQLLYHLGRESQDRFPLLLSAAVFASELGVGDGLVRALSRALRHAHSFQSGTRLPAPEELDSNAYLFLIDALDEVSADHREEVIDGLAGLAERFPQHLFIVTTRPIPDSRGLENAGFRPYRICLDEVWGREYLQERGIAKERVDELYSEAPTLSDLLGIPLYAALIGDRLSQEVQRPLPNSALALITEIGVRDAVRREAQRTGDNPDDLYRWLQTLAVCLEVRGRNEATVGELAAIPGPGPLEPERTRERLVLGALLKDQPDIAAFQTVTIQEGLAAEALLTTDDPVSTLREIAIAQIADREAFRSDIEHLLDLFFESADVDARGQLRKLDEFRWARTQSANIDESEAQETLCLLWSYFTERRIWVERRGERQIRGARMAIRRLATHFPAAAEALRPEIVAAMQANEPTKRGAALAFLQEFPSDTANVDIIRLRLQDEEGVVRRAAAEAAEELGLGELCGDLEAAYLKDTDQLALQTIGLALLGLTPEQERARLAQVLAGKHQGWSILQIYLLPALQLKDLLDFFVERGLRHPNERRLLSDEIKKRPRSEWGAPEVRMLARLAVGNARHYYEPFNAELLQELCSLFPDAALKGAQEGATNQTTWRELFFLRAIERQKLAHAARGILGKPLGDLLAVIEAYAKPPPPESPPQPEPRRRLSEWLAGGRLTESRCPDGSAIEELLRQVSELSTEERGRLAYLAEAWWPEGPLSDAVRVEGGHTTFTSGLLSALATSAALDLPLRPDRWLEIYGSRVLRVHWDAAEWLARWFPAERSHEIAAITSEIRDDLDLTLVLRALPKLSEEIADALAGAVIEAGISGNVLTRFREEGNIKQLRLVAERGQSEDLRTSARLQLAQMGDVEAQRSELRKMLGDIATDPRAYETVGLKWVSSAKVDVLPELSELLKAVARTFGPSESELGRALTSALAAVNDEGAVYVYDELIEGEDYVGGSFYCYQRDELVRNLARRRVLERLPSSLEDIAEFFRTRGYQLR
jgi:hypothetical protein